MVSLTLGPIRPIRKRPGSYWVKIRALVCVFEKIKSPKPCRVSKPGSSGMNPSRIICTKTNLLQRPSKETNSSMNPGVSDSSVTRLRDGELRNRFQEGTWDFLSPSRLQPRLWDPPSLLNGYCWLFAVLQRAARGTNHSLPTTAVRARRGAMRVITVPSYAFMNCCLICKYKNNNTIDVYFSDSKNACPPLCIIFWN